MGHWSNEEGALFLDHVVKRNWSPTDYIATERSPFQKDEVGERSCLILLTESA
jgi:hypothetical protein